MSENNDHQLLNLGEKNQSYGRQPSPSQALATNDSEIVRIRANDNVNETVYVPNQVASMAAVNEGNNMESSQLTANNFSNEDNTQISSQHDSSIEENGVTSIVSQYGEDQDHDKSSNHSSDCLDTTADVSDIDANSSNMDNIFIKTEPMDNEENSKDSEIDNQTNDVTIEEDHDDSSLLNKSSENNQVTETLSTSYQNLPGPFAVSLVDRSHDPSLTIVFHCWICDDEFCDKLGIIRHLKVRF